MLVLFTSPTFEPELRRAFGNRVPLRRFVADPRAARPDRLRSGLPAGFTAILAYQADNPDQKPLPVADHINLTTENPLIGFTEAPRFPDMSSVYEFSGRDGCVVVQGEMECQATPEEKIVPVTAGIWEAITLAHQQIPIRAWVAGEAHGLVKMIENEWLETSGTAEAGD